MIGCGGASVQEQQDIEVCYMAAIAACEYEYSDLCRSVAMRVERATSNRHKMVILELGFFRVRMIATRQKELQEDYQHKIAHYE